MEFDEYKPKGGWVSYRRRQKVKEWIWVALAISLLVLAYGVTGYIERGI